MIPLTRALCGRTFHTRRTTFRTTADIARDYAAARRVATTHKGAASGRRAALSAELDAMTLRALGHGELV